MTPRMRQLLTWAGEILLVLVIIGLLVATWLPAILGSHVTPPGK